MTVLGSTAPGIAARPWSGSDGRSVTAPPLGAPHIARKTERVASFGMYDQPELAAANDALWFGIAERLSAAGVEAVPERLDRSRPVQEIWRDDRLLLAQTCGYPLVTVLAGVVRPVAAPVYVLPGCEGPLHCSALVVPAASRFQGLDELRGAAVAINGHDSNTGMNLLRAAVAPLAGDRAFFGKVIVTGAHLASLAAVECGSADLAALDVVTVGLAMSYRPDLLDGVRVIGRTPASPTLPFVTRSGAGDDEVATIRDALADALQAPELAPAVTALSLGGIVPVTLDDYEVVARYASTAAAAGYPTLC